MNNQVSSTNTEREVSVLNGWAMLSIVIPMLPGGIVLLIHSIAQGARNQGAPIWAEFVPALLFIIGFFVLLPGFFTLQPNEARVLVLFGAYKGTARASGFHWGNPFYSNGRPLAAALAMAEAAGKASAEKTGGAQRKITTRNRISLRSRNLNGDPLKVNDKRGNPIEIAAVVVWRVRDTAQAMFDVEDYENYVRVQSESALRHLASCYAYDHGEENEITLRSGVEDVSVALCAELQERLGKAGVVVDEARLSHLAYAPEIAQAMLRRQQAEAVIAARQKIVHGAVSMVEMALRELGEKNIVHLDDARKAAMVSNLMVVLCGESEVHPVINTGTLHS